MTDPGGKSASRDKWRGYRKQVVVHATAHLLANLVTAASVWLLAAMAGIVHEHTTITVLSVLVILSGCFVLGLDWIDRAVSWYYRSPAAMRKLLSERPLVGWFILISQAVTIVAAAGFAVWIFRFLLRLVLSCV
jgi:hypothetical protein